MRWDSIPKRPTFMAAADGFCRRCGKKFIPVRHYHALCVSCGPKK